MSRKAAIILVLLALVLPELTTSSTPLTFYLNPFTYVYLLPGYGLAVLLVRELSVRLKLGLAGVFLLGMAYAVFNEGFLAKTMTLATNTPIPQYNGYGYILGVGFPFTITISLWHALASVLLPILITYYLYPKESEKPWLGKKKTIPLFIFLAAWGTLSFFGEYRGAGTQMQFAILSGLIIIYAILAVTIGKKGMLLGAKTASIKPVFLGISTLLFFELILFSIAGANMPIPVYFAVLFLGVLAYIFVLKAFGWLTVPGIILFGIGLYMKSTLVGLVLRILLNSGVVETIISASILEIIFVLAVIKIRKNVSSKSQRS